VTLSKSNNAAVTIPVREGSVDVLIAVRNGSRYLREAIDSAIAQTYPRVNVHVVDDGSTDDSAEIARSYGARVRCVQTAPRGLSLARNTGLNETQGEYVAFLDADDRWHPEKLALQVAYLRERPHLGLVHTRQRFVDQIGQPISLPATDGSCKKASGRCLLELIRGNTVVISSVLVRRSAIGKRRFDTALYGAQDYALWLHLAQHYEFGYLDEELTDHRLHEDAMSRSFEKMKLDVVSIMDMLLAAGLPDVVCHHARQRRNSLFHELAYAAYARGDHPRAREYFGRFEGPLAPRDRLRYLLSYSPAAVARTLRRVSGFVRKRMQFAS
jgi:glycosyltransferase involved in cell wall biosynthesis